MARNRHDELDFDPDEDLFDFGESAMASSVEAGADEDLDEIFAAFQAEEEAERALEAVTAAPPVDEFQRPASEPETVPEFDDAAFVPEPDPMAEAVPPAPFDEEELEAILSASSDPAPDLALEDPLFDASQDIWSPSSESEAAAPEDRPVPHDAPDRAARHVAAVPGAQRVVVSAPGVPPALLWIFIAVACLNGLLAVVTLQSTASMHNAVREVGDHVVETADEIRDHSYDQARQLATMRDPVVPTDPEAHPTFERALEEIHAGRYSEARRHVYSLLAVIDRLDASQRQAVEARAQFLLAEALHLEALERLEDRP